MEETPGVFSEEELTKDLITIITVFSARLYGRFARSGSENHGNSPEGSVGPIYVGERKILFS